METKLYEIHYLFTSELSEEGGKRWVEKLQAIIQKLDGHIVAFGTPTRESLAYPVDKKKIAVRLRTECALPPDAAAKLLEQLKHEQEILRIFVVTKPKERPKVERRRPLEYKVPVPETEAPVSEPTESAPKEKMPLEDIDKRLEELLK